MEFFFQKDEFIHTKSGKTCDNQKLRRNTPSVKAKGGNVTKALRGGEVMGLSMKRYGTK